MPPAAAKSIPPGFKNPAINSQSVFRAALNAFAEPGRLFPLPFREFFAAEPPGPAGPLAIALALCDFQTAFWLSESLRPLYPYIVFHTGAEPRAPEEAGFLFASSSDELPELETLSMGSETRPDLSATVTVALPGRGGGLFEAMGPGIRGTRLIEGVGLPPRLMAEREGLASLYPQGLDFIFCLESQIMALPRTTRIREADPKGRD